MKTPILTYNDKNFYDLDEVEDYLIDINDNIAECKKFRRFIHQLSYENDDLWEMIYARSEFIKECSRQSDNIHFTIINIICLQQYVSNKLIAQWKNDLIKFTKDLIKNPEYKNVNKLRILDVFLLLGYGDHYNNGYTYLNTIVYEDAMAHLLVVKNKSHKNESKLISKYIKNNIFPYIDTFVNPNKDRVYDLFNGLIEACNKSKMEIFNEALNDFINYNNNK